MMFKTHLAIGIFAIILFLPIVSDVFIFVPIALAASVLPDIDTNFSKVGKSKPAKVVQVFTEHRGFLHSLTICILISLLLAVFLPVAAFGFFLGYSLHLISDSFTKMGITPFWPYSKKAQGFISTGGVTEKTIFVIFVFIDIIAFAVLMLK
ncbi:metal-dependent hydrolase [Candidatus Pacearchaeota archaeon]|nr:metal-dependent hydrolase [Candidatus Pacearchaeota archaeon]